MATDKSIELILFEEIKTAIEAVTEIKGGLVAWNNQATNENEERPYLYPYVAIDITTDWQDDEATNNYYYLAQNQKKGDTTINVYIVFSNRLDETDSFLQNKPVAHKVHRAINCLRYQKDDGNITPLYLTNTNMDTNHDAVMVLQYTYKCAVKEVGIEADQTSGDVEEVEITREEYED